MIEVARVGILRHPVLRHAHRAQNAPRAAAQKMFARHRRKRLHHRRTADRGREAQLFRIALSRHGNRIGPALAPWRRSGKTLYAGIENAAEIELVMDRDAELPQRWDRRLELAGSVDRTRPYPTQPEAAAQVELHRREIAVGHRQPQPGATFAAKPAR